MSGRTTQRILAGVFVASFVWLCLVASQHLCGWPVTLTAGLAAEKLRPVGSGGAAVARIPVAENQPGRLLEDAREIGIPAAKISEVSEQGHGRFKTKAGQLYFSSSDGTTPANNGRKYVFSYPWKAISPIGVLIGVLAFAAAGGTLFFLHRTTIGRFLDRFPPKDSAASRILRRIADFFSDRDVVFERER